MAGLSLEGSALNIKLKTMKKLKLITKEKESADVNINKEDIDVSFFDNIDDELLRASTNGQIAIRITGEFAEKAICLSDEYDYVVGEDSCGETILVILEKK